jgi:hypothetical protein
LTVPTNDKNSGKLTGSVFYRKLAVVIIGTERKNPAAVLLGRLGGLKGGKARAEKLSPERRKEIAQLAAKKRWGK